MPPSDDLKVIKDRRPTKADEDEYGYVWMEPEPFTDRPWCTVCAAHVGPGVPWCHTDNWGEPQPDPEPAPHPEKPQVGQVWKTRGGTYVTITSQEPAEVFTCTTNHFIQRADLLEPVTYPKVPRLFAEPPRRTFSPSGAPQWDALADDGTAWKWSGTLEEWDQHKPLPDREEPTND